MCREAHLCRVTRIPLLDLCHTDRRHSCARNNSFDISIATPFLIDCVYSLQKPEGPRLVILPIHTVLHCQQTTRVHTKAKLCFTSPAKVHFYLHSPSSCSTRESAGGGTPPTGMLEIIESDLSEELAGLSVAYSASMPWRRPRRVRQRSPQRRKQRKPISQTLRTGISPPYWQEVAPVW